ncbi:MAG: hypothetical protein KJ077_32910 [Anaerolineae bacterium]|nr:hypothetical protein [Anaerolineae bacterium]
MAQADLEGSGAIAQGPDTQFRQNAVREMINYFQVVDEIKFYAFGDPAAQPTKKNGDPGVNAYDKIAEAYREAGGRNLGELTVKLKEYTEAKVQKLIEAYLDSKVQAEAPVEATQETLPGVPNPVGNSGGAAYNL